MPLLPPPRCLAVDVDDTLLHHNIPNPAIVAMIRAYADQGWDVIVWSLRGRAYAQAAADLAGIAELAVCVGKPGVVVDDKGLDWLQFSRVVRMS